MYKYLNSARHSLESSTLSLLERIDAFVYPLLSEKSFQYNGKELQSATPQYVNLGQLHDTLEVELVDALPEKVQTYSVTVGYARREYEKMNAYFEQIRSSFDSVRDNREYAAELEMRMGDYGSAARFWKDILAKHEGEPESKTIEVASRIVVTGDYCRAAAGATPRVRLVNQHRDYAIATTYIHEMFHAYYDWNHKAENAAIEYVEEALVEYAMLRFVAAFVAANPQDHRLFDEARRNVRSKLTYPGTAHYGLGAVLYESYSNTAAWELLYRKGKFAIDPQSPTVAQYKGLFVAGSLQDTNMAVNLLLQILAEALNLPMMTAAPTQGVPTGGGTTIGGYNLPNTLQTTIVSQYDPQEAKHWLRKGFTKVQYHTILNDIYQETNQYMVFDMLVDDVNAPKRFIAMLPREFRLYSERWCPILMVNRGGVFDPATFSIVGGKWAQTDGYCFLTDFIYDNAYLNEQGVMVVSQCRQDMMLVGGVNENGEFVTSSQPMIQWGVVGRGGKVMSCASEAVAQSIERIIDNKILIARTKKGDEQMINASGTPLSKEYNHFGDWNMGVIEVCGRDGKSGLVAKDGAEVIAPIYDEIEFDWENGKKYDAKRDGKEFILCKNEEGKWGEKAVEKDEEQE